MVRQLFQSTKDGSLVLLEVPTPRPQATEVTVATEWSVISSGTERAVRNLAGSSLVRKAMQRPDLVREVWRRARVAGLRDTASLVRSRLEDQMPLGYSGVGTVLEVGEYTGGLRPGMRVATAGAGHGEVQTVPALLAVPVPEQVASEKACFATLMAIVVNALRLGGVELGSRVCVVGLGLLGQLAVRVARACGCPVVGVDPRAVAMARASRHCDQVAPPGESARVAVAEWSEGEGADVTVVCASDRTPGAARAACEHTRERGTVVVVGDVRMDLDRRLLYERELTVRVARSYGPGRYDHSYERLGVDYPPGVARWTAGRNMAAALDLLARGSVDPGELVTHRFPFERVAEAYEVVERDPDSCAVLLSYDRRHVESLAHGAKAAVYARSRGARAAAPTTGRRGVRGGVGLVGAGSFAERVLVPGLRAAGFAPLVAVSSASGRTAERLAERFGFARTSTDARRVIVDPDVDVVFIAAPHDVHAPLTVEALRAGKHVFCEKPLAISEEQLTEVAEALAASDGVLMVGFNRRWSPWLREARRVLTSVAGPATISYRVNAGRIPPGHWYADRRQGGRIIGEVCHFVDTCMALVEARVVRVSAVGGVRDGADDVPTTDDVSVAMEFEDGSLASIVYASVGSPSTPKENLVVFKGSRTCEIDDWRRLVVDGRSVSRPRQDKGHREELRVFAQAVLGGDREHAERALETTAVTLAIVESLSTGCCVVPRVP
ncbi:MAG: oxidoreductase [Acidimicrobiales bacterium]|nr:MAG: oxidoreductase [Acidimicrobiales bacterium]